MKVAFLEVLPEIAFLGDRPWKEEGQSWKGEDQALSFWEDPGAWTTHP